MMGHAIKMLKQQGHSGDLSKIAMVGDRFDIDMKAGGKRRQGETGMCRGRGGDHHTIEIGLTQQPADGHRAGAEFLGKPGGAVVVLVGNRRQRAERGKITSQIPAPHAAANQSDACHRHLFPDAHGDAHGDVFEYVCESVACPPS